MNDELILYYVNNLILQYRTKEKAPEHIYALIKALMIYDLMEKVQNGYNIDEAIGVQLDVLAKYVGADRVITGLDFSRTYFGFVDYNEPTPYVDVIGLIEYAELNPPDAQFLKYDTDQQFLYTLTDEELRLLVKMKIIQNNSNYTTSEIDDFIDEFFPETTIFDDNKDMTISYIFDEESRRFAEIVISQGALPKPAAVGLIILYASDINNIFGFLKYSSTSPENFIQGMIEYSDDPFGSFLKY